MKSYGQYCPIARAAEVLAERWTPIIMRNVLLGCQTFNEIAAGAPRIPRALLTSRLRELERAGLLEISPKPSGRGSLYRPTTAGREAWAVLKALGDWGDRWTDIEPEHADPNAVLWSWCQTYQRMEAIPQDRVVVRFDFADPRGRPIREWFLAERGQLDLCRFDPGFGDDVEVTIHDAQGFARWHMGLVDWADLLRGALEISGPRALCCALPTWNRAPDHHRERRARDQEALSASPR